MFRSLNDCQNTFAMQQPHDAKVDECTDSDLENEAKQQRPRGREAVFYPLHGRDHRDRSAQGRAEGAKIIASFHVNGPECFAIERQNYDWIGCYPTPSNSSNATIAADVESDGKNDQSNQIVPHDVTDIAHRG